ncbi:MAG: hypothetical protein FJ308_14800 [Planctomycetes bacterium]|nr:hypothetical protein [Planctomycetota bacterium]
MPPSPPPLRRLTTPPLPPLPSPPEIGPVQKVSEHEDTRNSIVIAASVVGFLVLAVLFLSLFVGSLIGGGADSGGGNEAKGDVEGVLATEDSRGQTLDEGQSDSVTKAAGNPNNATAAGTSAMESTEIDSSSSIAASTDTEGTTEPGESNEPDEKESTTIPTLNTYTRSPAASLSFPRPSNPSRAGAAGTDLATSKGINPFVGEGKPAASTVYVIDVSGSMQDPTKLPRVMNALIRGIDDLKASQKFCVYLFDFGYYFEPSMQQLTPANNANKQKAKAWLSNPPGGGGTNPVPAMYAAITQEPERIVLLSDGEFDPYAVDQITQMNQNLRKPARIDCVGLMEQVIVLQEIARQNKGVYYQAW